MAKVKFLSLLTIFFLILSNISLAQYSDASLYGGKPIDVSKEGKEYYREGNVIVYPARMSSEEERMMERFSKGGISEEEMRRMAKSKSGEKFSEMEFEKSILEFKERMQRKDTFSYEHEGFEDRYYMAPSYEGYSREHMIFGMIFRHIGDDIDPREIKQNCNAPEKIADTVIAKLKEKVGDLQSLCRQREEEEAKCAEFAKKGCSQIGIPLVRDDATEMEKLMSVAYSCPVNQDAIVGSCKKRNKLHMEQRLQNINEMCEKRFGFEGERLVKECERFRQNTICDREKFVDRCMGGRNKEDFDDDDKSGKSGFQAAQWQCYDGSTESQRDSSCKSSEEWQELARKSCEGRCYEDKSKCGVNSFSVSGECKVTQICPVYPVPSCGEGQSLKTKTDSNGCAYYYCETIAVSDNFCEQDTDCACGRHIKTGDCFIGHKQYVDISKQCPDFCSGFAGNRVTKCANKKCASVEVTNVQCTQDVKPCPDGSYVARDSSKNCEFKPCPSIACAKPICEGVYNTGGLDANKCPIYKCPESTLCTKPTCEGAEDTGKRDSNGCIIYACPTNKCVVIAAPTCVAGETLQAYYDNAGCVTSYQCIKYQTSCPEVSRPACAEGQSMTTKYEDKGCITGYECITISSTSITGSVIGVLNYDDLLMKCENSWQSQQRICLNIPDVCDRSAFIDKCKLQERKNYDDFIQKIEQNCQSQTIAEIKHAEQRCNNLDKERQRCAENSIKRCGQMKGLAEKCKELMTEEKLRSFIIEEAKKRCKFTNIIEEEDDVAASDKVEIVLAVLNTATEDDIEKLELFIEEFEEELKLQDTTVYKGTINPNRFGDIKLMPFVVNAKLSTFASSERAKEVKAKIVAGQKVEEAASKLVSLRDSDVPAEYLYIIEDKASDVLDVSDNLEEIEKKEEQKGIGYKVRLFLGLAKRAEQEEIRQLSESKDKLQNSIETLAKLADEVPSDVAKAILKEQVENLKEQQTDIEVLIETKAKKAKGLFGVFG